jgi:hypothetical protein
VKTIVGRLSDFGLAELLRLLAAASAEGVLEIDAPAGRVRLEVRGGRVPADVAPPLVMAYATRSGTYSFRPGTVEAGGERIAIEEFIVRIDAAARESTGVRLAMLEAARQQAAQPGSDPLAEIRDSLAAEQIPLLTARVLLVTADPKPYRELQGEWLRRGWDTTQLAEPEWPRTAVPDLVVVHIPAGATLGATSERWLRLVRHAAAQRPPVPVLWIGGMSDPRLRHQVIMAGADFMLPAIAGSSAESDRWFREEVQAVCERLLARRAHAPEEEASALRELFLALHVEAPPAEVRASLLRMAGSYFGRAVLFAVRERGFESLGGFGFEATPARAPRGVALLEGPVVDRAPLLVRDWGPGEVAQLGAALGVSGTLAGAEVLPVLAGEQCVALLVADRALPHEGGRDGLIGLLARCGALLGV